MNFVKQDITTKYVCKNIIRNMLFIQEAKYRGQVLQYGVILPVL